MATKKRTKKSGKTVAATKPEVDMISKSELFTSYGVEINGNGPIRIENPFIYETRIVDEGEEGIHCELEFYAENGDETIIVRFDKESLSHFVEYLGRLPRWDSDDASSRAG